MNKILKLETYRYKVVNAVDDLFNNEQKITLYNLLRSGMITSLSPSLAYEDKYNEIENAYFLVTGCLEKLSDLERILAQNRFFVIDKIKRANETAVVESADDLLSESFKQGLENLDKANSKTKREARSRYWRPTLLELSPIQKGSSFDSEQADRLEALRKYTGHVRFFATDDCAWITYDENSDVDDIIGELNLYELFDVVVIKKSPEEEEVLENLDKKEEIESQKEFTVIFDNTVGAVISQKSKKAIGNFITENNAYLHRADTQQIVIEVRSNDKFSTVTQLEKYLYPTFRWLDVVTTVHLKADYKEEES